MVVEELVSVLGLEIGAGALATLEKFRNSVATGLAGLAGIGAVAAGAFVGVVASVAHLGDQIQLTSEKLGVSTDALQELRFAADQSDVSFDALTTGLKFLSKNAVDAAEGSKEAQAAFAGIPIHKANGQLRTADELLFAVTDRFNEIKDPIKQTQLAMKLFGRSGVDMIPMLKQGTKGIEAMIDDAHELGVVLDKDTIDASNRFDQQLKRLRDSLLGLRNTLGGPFVGAFADAMQEAADTIKRLRPFVKLIAAAIQDAWVRFKNITRTIIDTTRALGQLFSEGMLGKIVGAVDGVRLFEAAVIGLGLTLVATGVSAAASWVLALAPFIVLAVLIGLIVDELQTFIAGGDSMLGRILEWTQTLNPDDSPIIKFFKAAIALLTDFTDPAKWTRFKEAAIEAIDDIKDHLRVALGGKKFVKVNGVYYSEDLLPDARGFTGKTTQDGPEGGGSGGIFAPGGVLDSIKRKFRPELYQGQLSPFSGGAAGPAAEQNFTPGPSEQNFSSAPPVVIRQNNTYQINASGMTPEQLKQTMREHDDERNREALQSLPRP